MVSGVSTGSIGVPAATRPSSGTFTARPIFGSGTSSSARLWFACRRMRPFRSRFVRCLCTVASDASEKCRPISSSVGA
jgi:hypothetical protein